MLEELYRETILDHGRKPRNSGHIDAPTHSADGWNPLCGDQVRLYLVVKDDVITDVKFEGCGCAISQASTSLMTETVKGMTVEEALDTFDKFHAMVVDGTVEELGGLECLAGVREFPARIKCATLGWHALRSALAGEEAASTE
ncbi:MAG: SUF system NifU family Fe-S cluster assembly protein [Fimbriimonadaceae bacterium]|nr:SUF system NifU family Fe-S cluster assembly protein [Fimbriimonadaceae bacterium]